MDGWTKKRGMRRLGSSVRVEIHHRAMGAAHQEGAEEEHSGTEKL